MKRQRKSLPIARSDLIIRRVDSPDNDQAAYLVRDPVTGETFEFGDIEHFILSHLDGVTDRSQIIAELFREFDTRVTTHQFEDFLNMLAQWGLLQELAQTPLSRRPSRPHRATANTGPAPAQPRKRSRPGSNHEELIFHDAPQHHDPYLYDDSANWDGDLGNGINLNARPETVKTPGHWSWFNPDKLFYLIGAILKPFRMLVYLLPLAFVVALVAIVENLNLVVIDLPRVWGPVNLVQHLLFSLVTVNLVTQVLQGTVARGFGITGQSFGIFFAFGLIPRFHTSFGDITHLPRATQIWIHASQLLTGVALFTAFSLLWLTSRTTGTALYAFAMTISTVAVLGTALRANPLFKGPGYYALTAYLEFPDLREKAFSALFGKFLRRSTPRTHDIEYTFALKSYALACFIFFFSLFGIVLYFVARFLELHYQGTGVALFLLLLTFLVWRFYKIRGYRMTMRRQRIAEARLRARNQALARTAGVQRGTTHLDTYVPTRATPRRKNRWVGLIVVAAILFAAFLPYPYETGGPATTLPVQQHELHSETSGVVENVNFRGGEWVSRGMVIAELASYEQQKNVSVTIAAIQEQQSKLDRLLNTPTKEELDVALKKLQTARTQGKYSTDNAVRYEKLFKQGHVSLDEYQDAMRKREVDEAQVVEAKANLDLVKSGAHPNDIEAARSELEGLRQQLAYYEEQLKRTALVMPVDARLVTPDLHLKKGKYLEKGALFAVAENDRTIRVEISVPESDIADVEIGSATRLKIWTYPDRTFKGEVTEIAPVVSDDETGKYVRVISDIPNPQGLIKSGMTGFGKIDGGTKPVYAAFTRLFVRFALIEIWSWLP